MLILIYLTFKFDTLKSNTFILFVANTTGLTFYTLQLWLLIAGWFHSSY
jgi:hypothetical protein